MSRKLSVQIEDVSTDCFQTESIYWPCWFSFSFVSQQSPSSTTWRAKVWIRSRNPFRFFTSRLSRFGVISSFLGSCEVSAMNSVPYVSTTVSSPTSLSSLWGRDPVFLDPAQIVSSAKGVVSDTKDMVTSSIAGAKGTVSHTLTSAVAKTRGAVQGRVEQTRAAVSTVGQLVSSGVDTALTTSESLVEHYLPLTEEELGESLRACCSHFLSNRGQHITRMTKFTNSNFHSHFFHLLVHVPTRLRYTGKSYIIKIVKNDCAAAGTCEETVSSFQQTGFRRLTRRWASTLVVLCYFASVKDLLCGACGSQRLKPLHCKINLIRFHGFIGEQRHSSCFHRLQLLHQGKHHSSLKWQTWADVDRPPAIHVSLLVTALEAQMTNGEKKDLSYPVRLGHISTKFRKRASSKALAKIRDGKQRSLGYISALSSTVDLVSVLVRHRRGDSRCSADWESLFPLDRVREEEHRRSEPDN